MDKDGSSLFCVGNPRRHVWIYRLGGLSVGPNSIGTMSLTSARRARLREDATALRVRRAPYFLHSGTSPGTCLAFLWEFMRAISDFCLVCLPHSISVSARVGNVRRIHSQSSSRNVVRGRSMARRSLWLSATASVNSM